MRSGVWVGAASFLSWVAFIQPHADAAKRVARVRAGKQQLTMGRGIFPGQAAKLALEVLKGQIDAEPIGIFAKQCGDGRDLQRLPRLDEIKLHGLRPSLFSRA